VSYTQLFLSGKEQIAYTSIVLLKILFFFLLIFIILLNCYRESEYAAWTLVNGYALNHVTISTHRLKSDIRKIQTLNKFIEDSGFKLNSEGGILKGSLLPFLYLQTKITKLGHMIVD
jgi:Domain of unknown function (DUF1338)